MIKHLAECAKSGGHGIDCGGNGAGHPWTPAQVKFTCLTIPNNENYLGGDGTDIYVIQANTTFTDPTLGLLGFLGFSPWVISVPHQERIIGPG